MALLGITTADHIQVGDRIFVSYNRPISGNDFSAEFLRTRMGLSDELVCAWVVVEEIKHHTDTTVTLFSSVVGAPDIQRWVEYPRDAPIVLDGALTVEDHGPCVTGGGVGYGSDMLALQKDLGWPPENDICDGCGGTGFCDVDWGDGYRTTEVCYLCSGTSVEREGAHLMAGWQIARVLEAGGSVTLQTAPQFPEAEPAIAAQVAWWTRWPQSDYMYSVESVHPPGDPDV